MNYDLMGDMPDISYFDKEAATCEPTKTMEDSTNKSTLNLTTGQDGRLSSQTRPARTYRRLLPSGRFTGR